MTQYLKSNTVLWLAGIILSAAAIWPWFVLGVVGDDFQHYALIECFGTHIWEGHFYPRWCMNGNAGYGSPAPMFYQPLPYYVTTLFYPLRHWGLDEYGMLVLGIWLAPAVGFVTTTWWLETVTSRLHAALCSFVLLWLCYHAEITTFRTAYPELWTFSLLSLLFMQMRNMVLHKKYQCGRMAVLIMICLLMHTITTMIGLIACGLYALAHIQKRPKAMWVLIGASALALCATIANFFQYSWLTQHLNAANVTASAWMMGWANNFVTAKTIIDRVPIILYFYALCFVIVAFATPFLRKPALIEDSFVRRELTVWGGIGVVAFVMMFPISGPLWDIIESVTHFRAPWRMRLIVIYGFIYLLAVFTRYGWGVVIKKRWGDALGMFLMLFLFNCNTIIVSLPESVADRIKHGKTMFLMTVAAPRWMDGEYEKPWVFYEDFVEKRQAEPIGLLKGKGDVKVKSWGYGEITFQVDAARGDIVRIDHIYFPTWRATLDGAPAELEPGDDGKGLMQLAVPAGTHDVRITFDWMAAMPGYYRWVCLLSLGAFCAILWVCFKERRRSPPYKS